MIYVDRLGIEKPKILSDRRVLDEIEGMHKMAEKSEKYLNQLRIKLNPRYYNHSMVRKSLQELFHGKCAYCESKIMATETGDLEHFRPKGLGREGNSNIHHLYYAWLGYDWDNLLVACRACNFGKKDQFPVKGERAKIWASVAECWKQEKPLLLDPTHDRPEEHIEFLESGHCSPTSERGEVTIEFLRLNRDELVRSRSLHWAMVNTHCELIVERTKENSGTINRALTQLKEYSDDRGEYAAVARTVIAKHDLTHQIAELYEETMKDSFMADQTSRGIEKKYNTKRSGPDPIEKAEQERPPLAAHYITKVNIKKFKAIKEIEIIFPPKPVDENLAPTLMLLGENSTGKSSVLEAIALTLIGTTEIAKLKLNLFDFVHRTNWEYEDSVPTDIAEINLTFSDGINEKELSLVINPKTGKITGNELSASVLLAYGPRRFFPEKRIVRKKGVASDRIRTLFDPMAVITNPKNWLMNCTEAHFNAAVRALREVLMLSNDAFIERPPRGKRKGKKILFEIDGYKAPLSRMSEGYKTVVAMTVDIMREMLDYWPDLENARGLVLVDEIETHLHPRWKMRIVRALRNAMPNVQFILTTHDPLCLRGMKDGEVQVMQKSEETGAENLTELPNLQGLSVQQLLTSDLFGLYSTEDPELEMEVAQYIDEALQQKKQGKKDDNLVERRSMIQEKLKLGNTPGEQIVADFLIDSMVTSRSGSVKKKRQLKAQLKNEALKVYKSVRTKRKR